MELNGGTMNVEYEEANSDLSELEEVTENGNGSSSATSSPKKDKNSNKTNDDEEEVEEINGGMSNKKSKAKGRGRPKAASKKNSKVGKDKNEDQQEESDMDTANDEDEQDDENETKEKVNGSTRSKKPTTKKGKSTIVTSRKPMRVSGRAKPKAAQKLESPKKKEKASMKSKKSTKNTRDRSASKKEDNEVSESERDYEVEKILEVRSKGGSREFRVKWKGYSVGDSSWEPEEHLNCDELIKTFLAKNSQKAAAPKRGYESAGHSSQKKAKVDKEDYEVEKIVGMEIESNGTRKFKIKWKGYPLAQSSWEPEAHLQCPALIKEFISNEKDKSAKGTGSKSSSSKRKTESDDDGDEDYEVKEILDMKMVKGKRSFLIHWEGYPKSGATWEPEENLECADMIKNFMKNESSNGKAKKGSDETNYEVEKIMDMKTVKGKHSFLVKWKGCSVKQASWEPESNLNCEDLVDAFKATREDKKAIPVGRPGPKSRKIAENEENKPGRRPRRVL